MRLHWCTKFDEEINNDFMTKHPTPQECFDIEQEAIRCGDVVVVFETKKAIRCESCIFAVFETKNEIRARKALEAGRKQPSLCVRVKGKCLE